MKSWPALIGLVVVTITFAAQTDATSALLSILNGTYYGHDCQVKVSPSHKGVSVEIDKDNQHMEYFVHSGSDFQFRPERFQSSYRINKGGTDYAEYSFMTTPTSNGQYAVIKSKTVKKNAVKIEKIECEIIDDAFISRVK